MNKLKNIKKTLTTHNIYDKIENVKERRLQNGKINNENQ